METYLPVIEPGSTRIEVSNYSTIVTNLFIFFGHFVSKMKKEICRIQKGKMTDHEMKVCMVNHAKGSMSDIRSYYDTPIIHTILQFMLKVFYAVGSISSLLLSYSSVDSWKPNRSKSKVYLVNQLLSDRGHGLFPTRFPQSQCKQNHRRTI